MVHSFWLALALSLAIVAALVGLAWLAARRWPRSRYWILGNGYILVSCIIFALLFTACLLIILFELVQGNGSPWWYYPLYPAVWGLNMFNLRRSWRKHRERGRGSLSTDTPAS
jgi:ABC-type maltose transport system permease subunit